MASGSGDPWKISGEERAKHDAQFFSLKPVNGFVTGAQARDFFMQSGLPTPVLGQIWSLADMNGDGKMDKLEFSVAMHLIKKKLQGYELPKVLPASLKVAPSPVIGSFGMQAGPMPMGQSVVMGMAPAMNPPMGMPLSMSGSMMPRMPQASLGTSTMTTGSLGMPLMSNGVTPASSGMQGMGMPASMVIPPVQPASAATSGWTISHPSKLKYTQLFNSNDHGKRGYLTGVEARGILMQSGLPQTVLAQIWALSDVDNDGKLTCDEFCIAMHLTDMARLGRALPPKLPPELLPSKGRSGSFGSMTAMPGGVPLIQSPPQTAPQQKDAFGDLLSGVGISHAGTGQFPGQPAPMEDPAHSEDLSLATFEDKRKENFDKGQAELERRRAALQEQLKAEENARLEKERLEAEKRERIRMEQEARRQEEMHRQLEKQRKIEMEREEQRRKMLEQKEQARRELERQRQMEWERQRKEQLMAEKQREYEQLAILKSQSTNLKGQLESLDLKKNELTQKISQVKDGVTEITTSIENMRIQRDTALVDIERFERESNELILKLSRLNAEKDQLQTQLQTQQNTPLLDAHRTVMHSVELKKTNIQKLRRELQQTEQETETKLGDIDNGNIQLKSLKSLIEQLQRDIPALQAKQQEARTLRQQQEMLEKAAKEKEHQEQARKEADTQRKREEVEKRNTAAAVNGSTAAKEDGWFAFGGGTSSVAASSHGDVWGSAFSSADTATAATAGDVWGSSDPFSSQAAGGAGIKKTRYRVLFPFESRTEDELTINNGDIVMVWDVPSEPGMEEWYKGDVNGMVGWFPQAYAEPCPQPTSAMVPTATSAISAFSTQSNSSDLFGSAFQPVVHSAHASPAPLSAGISNGAAKSPVPPSVSDAAFQPSPDKSHKAPEGLTAQALYQWKARQENHLSFNKDDFIVVKEQEELWWMGELGGKVGWFPKAYVRLIEGEKTSLSSQTSSPMGTLDRSASARVSPAPDKKDGEYHVAMYGYSSGEPADLVFNEGDMILVTKRDDDWWTGTLGDKTGIFPASYVKKVDIQASAGWSLHDELSTGITGHAESSNSLGTQSTLSVPDLGPQQRPKAPPRRSRSKKDSASDSMDTETDIYATVKKKAPTVNSQETCSNSGSAMPVDFDLFDFSSPSIFDPSPPSVLQTAAPLAAFGDNLSGQNVVGSFATEAGSYVFDEDPFANTISMPDSAAMVSSSEPSGGFNLRAEDMTLSAGEDPFAAFNMSEIVNTTSVSSQFVGTRIEPVHSEGDSFSFASDPFMNLPSALDPNRTDPFLENVFQSSDISNQDGEKKQSSGIVDGDITMSLSMSTIMKDTLTESTKEQDAPAQTKFYLGEDSVSTSSSFTELAALDEMAGQKDIHPSPLHAKVNDPFADLFNNVHLAPVKSPTFAADPLEQLMKSVDKAPPMADSGLEKEADVALGVPATSPLAGGPFSTESTSQIPVSSFDQFSSERDFFQQIAAAESQPGEQPVPVTEGFKDLEVTSATPNEPGPKSSKKPEIAQVIAPYAATGSGQLSLELGNLIHVRQKSPRGWWEGELQARGQRKKVGWFPANYVKLLGSSSNRSTPDNILSTAATSSSGGGSRSNTPQPQPTAPAPALPPSAVPAERLVALYPYTAQNSDELSFEKDALITVLKKDNPDWWHGEVNGQTGLFPSNYVASAPSSQAVPAQSWLMDSVRDKLTGAEKQRQMYIQELITTEETYNADMAIVLEVFRKPLIEEKVLMEAEAEHIFVNWNELIICNKKFLQALRVRKKMCGKGKVIFMIGDILCENLPHMTPYVRFCSCQLSAAQLLQRKTEYNPDFVEVHKKCVTNPAAKGMPMSSFLLKPMQRITKYPLLIQKILQYTPQDHPDRGNLEDALQKAEELCSQVNEGVRQKENSDRLEWIQRHVHCDGLAENITFNSVTNCLGSRKLLHMGVLYKVKSNKELVAFLFNDFLLLTVPPRVLGPSFPVAHIFDAKSKDQYRMYKTPIVLNEVMVKKPNGPDADACLFQISHIERVYHLRAPSETERELWFKHLTAGSRLFHDTEQKKRDRAHSSKKVPGVGRLLVVILEGYDLRASDSSGKSDPYCEVSMGSQEHRTRVVPGTLNPKWNASMQFTIRDLQQDVLCITVYDRDIYSPNDFLGRTEVRMREVLEEARIKKGPITKRLILHEVDTGEVIVKLDLQLYES